MDLSQRANEQKRRLPRWLGTLAIIAIDVALMASTNASFTMLDDESNSIAIAGRPVAQALRHFSWVADLVSFTLPKLIAPKSYGSFAIEVLQQLKETAIQRERERKMSHDLENTIALLERMPVALNALLRGLPEMWTHQNEGEGTFTVVDVVGHLTYADKFDWMPRARLILEHGETRPFEPFDRWGHVQERKGRTLPELLNEFAHVRNECLNDLRALNLTPEQLKLRGRHPSLGPVGLSELLATWAAHDLTHLHQISRIMAHQYRGEVGPFEQFLGILKCNGHGG